MSKSVKIGGVSLPIEELHFSFLTNKLRKDYGFIESSQRNIPTDGSNNIMPMYTYPCYEYINSLDLKGVNVFEYGTGYSSVYWSEKDVNYYAVEHNPEWFKRVKSDKTPNVILKEEPVDFVNSIFHFDIKFDLIVIDGIMRYDCVKPALENLNKGGIIILDNSDWHKNTKELLDKSDLIPIHFHGFKPLHVDSETTSCYIDSY